MNHFEKFKNQILSNYESDLAKEAREICKEVESVLGENNELIVEKAFNYCYIIKRSKRLNINLNPEFVERCINYLNENSCYNRLKDNLESISRNNKFF